MTKVGNKALADKVVEAYAESPLGPYLFDCQKINNDLTDARCNALREVMHDARVSKEEEFLLGTQGFSDEFVMALAGPEPDGGRVRRERIKWIADNITCRWYSCPPKKYPAAINEMICELAKFYGYNEVKYAVPALIEVLEDSGTDTLRRSAIYHTLGLIGRNAEIAAPTLLKFFGSETDAKLRNQAFRVLTAVNKNPKTMIPLLIRELESNPSLDTKTDAVLALRAFGSEAAPAVSALVNFLSTQTCSGMNQIYCRWALETLSKIGQEARAAIPTIMGLFDEKNNWELNSSIANAILAIGPTPDIIPGLVNLLGTNSTNLNGAILSTLETIGLPVVSELPRVFKSGNAIAIENAGFVLENIAGRTEFSPEGMYTYRQTYQERTESTISSDERTVYIQSLIDILEDPVAQLKIPPLPGNMFSYPTDAATSASVLLGKIGSPAVPQLIAALANPNPQTRYLATSALGEIGAKAWVSISHLENIMVNDTDATCRKAAEESLEKIEAEIL